MGLEMFNGLNRQQGWVEMETSMWSDQGWWKVHKGIVVLVGIDFGGKGLRLWGWRQSSGPVARPNGSSVSCP